MSQDYTLNSAIDLHRLKQNQLSRSLFEKWFNENKLDDEYFTRHEMYWFAEQAWLAVMDLWFNKKNETGHNDSTLL